MAIYLNERQVSDLLSPRAATDAVEDAFRRLSAGTVKNSPHHRVPLGPGSISALLASDSSDGLSVAKVYATGRTHVSSGRQPEGYDLMMILFCEQKAVAVMEACEFTRIKTAATSAVAVRHLARQDARTIGVFGCGYQAEGQLALLRALFPELTTVFAYCRTPASLERFTREHGAIASTPEEVAGQDIVVTVTTKNNLDPLIRGEWLAPGALVIVADANRRHYRSLDDDAVRRAGAIITSDLAESERSQGDLFQPVEQGLISWEDVHELRDVVAGRYVARHLDTDIVIFKSISLAAESLAMAKAVYDLATVAGHH